MVIKEYTFVAHIESDLVIDIFECEGSASLSYGSSVSSIRTPKEGLIFQEGINGQQHAFHLKTFSTTFFKVAALRAIVRWFPMDLERSIGTGYLDYQVGQLTYESSWRGLTIIWSSLKNKKKSSSIVNKIEYSLFVSQEEDKLKTASQCESSKNIIMHKANCIDANLTNLLNYTHSLSLEKS